LDLRAVLFDGEFTCLLGFQIQATNHTGVLR
jgi:hypothetical protein